MLLSKINEAVKILDELIFLTKEDIKNIKIANHDAVFSNTLPKEELAQKFYRLKNEIDEILVKRNKPIEEIFSKDEEIQFNIFKDKLNEFYFLHKKFSKLALSVANFYNVLLSKIKDEKPIDYSQKNTSYNSKIQIKA